MNNRQIADMFDRVADMLAIRGDNFHRVLAYRKASETLRALSQPVADIAATGSLTDLPNIGKTLAEKIDEMLETGDLAFYHRVAADVPPELVELLRVEGLGPKKVKLVYDKLGVVTMDDLETAARAGKLRDLPGMGQRSEEKILANLEALKQHGDDRFPLGDAWPLAQQILTELETLPGVTQTAVGGSLRRMCETIGDIDLLVCASAEFAPAIMDHFVNLPLVESISGHGPTKSRVTLLNGIGVDLRVLPAENWGTLLSYFTGSKAHNVKLRERARQRGLSLNEYDFTRDDGGDPILCATEEAVYATLDLPYIAPPLREDRGEIEAAKQGRLPDLIEQNDIIADLHMHSTWSDGKATILEMARAAQARGLHYIVISDHSRSLGIANGLSIEQLREQAAEIKSADAEMGDDFRILHGTEMEIKADGTLDYPDDVLAELDFVIASLHVSLSQTRDQVMKRVFAALDNPHVDMLAHPTGRLIPDRPGADLDMERVFMAALSTRTILEINANPRRLDLTDVNARRAAQLGVKIAINCDAHAPDHFDFLHYGVATAQRAWLTPNNVVNTWPLEKLLRFIN
ncbi:MAG: DNA polymerase/3'-5' exonuclease PolX [Anaerolineae bacterium]|nr:DNA polymerase/3'-5' exonuclease PolX [Anaerolineae bacterium]MCO5199324.1 DNA polymerase/3'-5' exonuclease PolX [Anaerolineae bacterium]